MNIPEELARNRAVYSRMRGQGAQELPAPLLPPPRPGPVRGWEGEAAEQSVPRLFSPPSPAGEAAIPVRPGPFTGEAQPVKGKKITVRGEAEPVYSLGRIQRTPAPEGVKTTVISAPGPAYPEPAPGREAAGVDSEMVLAALARRLESDARQRPQMQEEEGDGM